MRKALVIFQWCLVLLTVAGILYGVLGPAREPAYEPGQWKSWDGFMALSYTGITSRSDGKYVSPDLLSEHLNALKRAGYQTVRPADVQAFVKGESPPPKKALILLFEGGRKDSALNSIPILHETGFMATMCVPTHITEKWGSFYLKKPDLRRLAAQSYWTLCSMGHEASTTIETGEENEGENFLTHRKRTRDGAQESIEAFRSRVLNDYAKAAKVLSRAAEEDVTAYAYPFGDRGTRPGADPAAAEINLKGVAAHHSIAFVGSNDPFNPPGSDPYNLTRLRISAEWSGQRLVRELEGYWIRPSRVSGFENMNAWQTDGNVYVEDDRLVLTPDSRAWVKGSHDWSDLDAEVTTSVTAQNRAALYARYSSPESYLRVLLQPEGVQVQERLGSVMQTLYRNSDLPEMVGDRTIRLKVKGNRLWMWLDGVILADSIPLTRATAEGRIGLEGENAAVKISQFEARRSDGMFALAESYRSLPAEMKRNTTVVISPWILSEEAPRVADGRIDDLFSAAAEGVAIIPLLENGGDLSESDAEKIVTTLSARLKEARAKALVSHVGVTDPDGAFPALLKEEGFRILWILGPDEVSDVVNNVDISSGDLLLVRGAEDEVKSSIRKLVHRIPPRRLIAYVSSSDDLPAGVNIVYSK